MVYVWLIPVLHPSLSFVTSGRTFLASRFAMGTGVMIQSARARETGWCDWRWYAESLQSLPRRKIGMHSRWPQGRHFTTKNIDHESEEGKNKGRSDAGDDLLIAGATWSVLLHDVGVRTI